MIRKASLLALLLLALVMPLSLARANDLCNATWSETDASNNSASPNGWTPGVMLPNQVEPTAQAMMGALKRWYDHSNATTTSGGSAGVYTLSYSIAPAAYCAGDVYGFKANFTSVGADTLNVNSLGAKPMYRYAQSGAPIAIAAGDIQANQIVFAVYDTALNSAAGGWQVIGFVPLALRDLLSGWHVGDVVCFNGTDFVPVLNSSGSNGQYLSLVTSACPIWAAGGASVSSVQVYNTHVSSPFTWTKPAGISAVRVRVCGAGGGGAGSTAISSTLSGGGGGGAGTCNEDVFRAADLAATVSITIGQGGAPGANSGSATANGSAGSNTTFGSLLTGYAGGGGARSTAQNVSGGGGGSGGLLSAGGSTTGTSGGAAGTFGGVVGSAKNTDGASPTLPWIGGSAGGADDTSNGHVGGASVFGPGGGAGAGNAATGSPKNGAAGGATNGGVGGTAGTSGAKAGGTPTAANPCEGGPGGGSGWSSGDGTTPGAGGAGVQGGGGGGAGGGYSGTGALGGTGGDGFACVWSE